ATSPRRSTTRRCSRPSAGCSIGSTRTRPITPRTDAGSRSSFWPVRRPGLPMFPCRRYRTSATRGLRLISLPNQPQPRQREQIVDLVDGLADERHHYLSQTTGQDHLEIGAQLVV